jgi:hypothetical protein
MTGRLRRLFRAVVLQHGGPGPADERWKKTPHSQKWREETGQKK